MASFSVIVPNYNHGKFLDERIRSILSQTYQDFEIILLDDGSTDNSREILEQYRGHPSVSHMLFNEVNSGSPYHQWQRGIELASNEWIWIAESDDSAHPQFLQKCIDRMNDFPSAAMICVQSTWINESGEAWFTRQTGFEKEGCRNGESILRDYMIHENQVKNASAVVFPKKNISHEELENISRYTWCGDWALWNLLLSKGDFVFISEPLNYFRRHDKASSGLSYKQGLLYKEGLPLSLHYQDKSNAGILTRLKALFTWSGHLYHQYKSPKRKAGLFLFAPLYYCVLMHLALPVIALWHLYKKLFR